jgi:UDP-GlcNAc3NAcA epimerase
MSDSKIKLLSVVGARPQLMKATMLSKAIDKAEDFEEVLVHTGQHYDEAMSSSIISQIFNKKPNFFLNSGGKDEISMITHIMEKMKNLFEKINPNYVLVYGDTTSTLAAALATKIKKIPLIHVESGVRNYDLNMPEEFNRLTVDRISDINICATKHTYENLRLEAFATKEISSRLSLCGDLMFDCFKFFDPRVSDDLLEILSFNNLKIDDYILCTIHRQSNVDNENALKNIVKALNNINRSIPVLFPLHHRTRDRLKQFNLKLNCCVIDPVSYLDSLKLIRNCKFVITDSGGLVREAYFSKKLSLTISVEKVVWPEINFLEASINTTPEVDKIEAKIHEISTLNPAFEKKIFGDGYAAEKILSEIRLHFKSM